MPVKFIMQSDYELHNYTGHPIKIRLDGGNIITYKSEGNARLAASQGGDRIDVLANRVPVVSPYIYDRVEGLPEDLWTNIIVSDKLASYLVQQGYWRGDVYAPDTNEASRVEGKKAGSIDAVRQLILYPRMEEETDSDEDVDLSTIQIPTLIPIDSDDE